MFTLSINKTPKNYNKTIGLFYLFIAICGGFSIGYVPEKLIDLNNAATTAINIQEHATLFYLGIGGDVLVILFEILLTTMLFRLFENNSTSLNTIAAFSRYAMIIVMGINLINYITPLFLYNSDVLFSNSLIAKQDIALVFFHIHKSGEYIWELFFSVHLFALGWMILRSSYISKIFGYLMMIGSLGYFFQSIFYCINITNQITDAFVVFFLAISVLGELGFAFWLLIVGVKNQTHS